MNKNEAEEKVITIIQAWIDGCPIECKAKGAGEKAWTRVCSTEAAFNFAGYDYRLEKRDDVS